MKKLRQNNNPDNREAILNDSIPKTLLKLSWPIMVVNTMQVLFDLADIFWVGKLGAICFKKGSWKKEKVI